MQRLLAVVGEGEGVFWVVRAVQEAREVGEGTAGGGGAVEEGAGQDWREIPRGENLEGGDVKETGFAEVGSLEKDFTIDRKRQDREVADELDPETAILGTFK